ncbi:hypothetical protein NliqN6_1349 [Naganishia liquefaciens]|uniref:Uncharacterized protein n=1 Tax=Naganishia liquefaciens TaxID=104408 RepID=A0A8H3TPP5_9TREE|nr:hypothetical protein NliqN6_1349 [Naganishia liquefaciens]
MDDMSHHICTVLEEEDLSDELFRGDCVLRNVPNKFHSTRNARRLIMHCDVGELVLHPRRVGFEIRVVPIFSDLQTGTVRIHTGGSTSASVSLLPYSLRDSLIPRVPHIFLISDSVCFAHRTPHFSPAGVIREGIRMDNKEMWYIDSTIGILHPMAIGQTAYPDLPHVLVLQATPAVKATTLQADLLPSKITPAHNTSVVSLVPACAGDHQQLIQLEDALKTSMSKQNGKTPLIQSRPTATDLDRLHRSFGFWQERLNDVATSTPSPPMQARTAYSL